MGANGSYNKTLDRVRGKSRTHQEFHHRIDGHKILLQNKNKNQVKLPMNSNSESPIYLLGKVDKKTGTVKVSAIGIYENHKCVGQIDLKFNNDGSYKSFMDGKGSHYHKSLKYFYGESANAIKIQIWVTLIANLLLMVMQRGLTRSWSFSNLATMVRINLMYYVDFYSLFNHPEKDWEEILKTASNSPPEPSLFD